MGEFGIVNDDDARRAMLRRRCRSVLERTLLSEEYRRTKVRTGLRYEDFTQRVRIAVSNLDDRGRSDVQRLFDDVRKRYFSSLYDVSLTVYLFFSESARRMERFVRNVAALDRCDVDDDACNWLLSRLVDEYARVNYFKLYEYSRLYAMYVELRSDLQTGTSDFERRRLRDDASVVLNDRCETIRSLGTQRKDLSFAVNAVKTCVGIVESAITLDSLSAAASIAKNTSIVSMAASFHFMLESVWRTISRGAASSRRCPSFREKPWNLLINESIDASSSKQQPRDDDRLNDIESDEYFATFRLLSSCDRNVVRNDAAFYIAVFESMLDIFRNSLSKP